MYRSFRLILLAGGLVILSASSLHAQDAVLGQMYGSGVHAYFSRDYVKAHEYLTAAIDGGTGDPRCYYFRGLAYLKLGRQPESEMDFEKGAELESRNVNRFYNVARSLERVQGRRRLLLEQHRVKARMAALERAEQIRKVRYDQIREQESRVLQEQVEAAPEAPADLPAEPAEPAAEDPFAVGPLDEPAEEPTAEPTEKPIEEPVAEPAQKPAEQPATPDQADPFAMPGDEPAEEKPAAKPAEKPPAEKADADDPFAELTEEPPAKPVEPAEPVEEPPAEPVEKPPAEPAEEKPDDGDNPFQDEPAADDQPAADEKPAADEAPAAAEEPKADVDPADPFAQ